MFYFLQKQLFHYYIEDERRQINFILLKFEPELFLSDLRHKWNICRNKAACFKNKYQRICTYKKKLETSRMRSYKNKGN